MRYRRTERIRKSKRTRRAESRRRAGIHMERENRRRSESHRRVRKNRRSRCVKLLLPVIFAVAICAAGVLAYEHGVISFDQDRITLTDIMSSGRDPQIEAILESMTPEEKVGQMFMGCFYSGTPSPEAVEKYHLGGVLLFGASFKDVPRETFTGELRTLNETCVFSPIIAVDEEGGAVVRVSAYEEYRSQPFQSPRQLFDEGGMSAIISDVHEKNQLLSSLGIHMNLAPVCDMSQDPDDFMYDRSLGQDAQTTSTFAAGIVAACREDGVACSLKHFPGYGNSADTHKGLVVDKRPLEELEQRDLLPFQAGIDEGAPSALVSHNIVSSIDPRLPASMSPAVHRLLRQDMGFDGIIITDDLSMGAITNFTSKEESAVIAVLAGNDLLCTGDYARQYDAVLDALQSGMISEERVNASVRRILKLKMELGLLS